MAQRPWFQTSADAAFDTHLPPGREPYAVTEIGDAEAEPLGIYLSREAAAFIETYLMANPSRQLGGLLVGYPLQGERRPFLLITGAIEALHAHTAEGRFQFTESSWEHMQSVHAREFPDTEVVGWFQSQPGQGLRLSSYTQFTHHRFFVRSWQVSFIVDPAHKVSRFYRRESARLVEVDCFYYWNSERAPASRSFSAPEPRRETFPPRSDSVRPPSVLPAALGEAAAQRLDGLLAATPRWLRSRAASIVMIVLLAINLWVPAPGTLAKMRKHIHEESARLQRLKSELAALQTDAENLASLRRSLAQTALERPAPTLSVGSAPSPPPADRSASPASDEDGRYVVQPGDTMWHISARLLGDPLAFERLAAVNEIQDPDRIVPGAVLKLPGPQDGDE